MRPDGAQAEDAEGALRRVLRTTDPGAELIAVIDRAGRDKASTWPRDIEPWLGERVGAAMPTAGGGREDGIVIAASTDDDAAGDALAKLIPGGRERSPATLTCACRRTGTTRAPSSRALSRSAARRA